MAPFASLRVAPRLAVQGREKKNSPFSPAANGAQTAFFLFPPLHCNPRRHRRGTSTRLASHCLGLRALRGAGLGRSMRLKPLIAPAVSQRGGNSRPVHCLLTACERSERRSSGPMGGVEQRRARRIRKTDCLSPQGEFEVFPALTEQRRAVGPRPTAEVGSPFFGSFLWRSKERDCPAGGTSRQRPKAASPRRGETLTPLKTKP